MSINQNLRAKTIKLLEKDMGENFLDFGLGRVLRCDAKVMIHKRKN